MHLNKLPNCLPAAETADLLKNIPTGEEATPIAAGDQLV